MYLETSIKGGFKMPKMKYFQSLASIRDHYDDILRNFQSETYGKRLLETWNISWEERESIQEEKEVLSYLIGCQLSIVHNQNVKKPTIEIAKRCFNRHLDFLEQIHGCHQTNVNRQGNPSIVKQYKACRHYLFQFSLPAWLEKLPDEILTFENKYPSFRN